VGCTTVPFEDQWAQTSSARVQGWIGTASSWSPTIAAITTTSAATSEGRTSIEVEPAPMLTSGW
jgi:hypothetical protein